MTVLQRSTPAREQHLRVTQWLDVPPTEAQDAPLAQHLIVLHLTPQPVQVYERADGFVQAGIARPGDINVVAAGETSYCCWNQALSFFRLDLAPHFLIDVARNSEYRNPDHIELIHTFHHRDEKVWHIGQWLHDDIKSVGTYGALYTDALMQVLAAHLLSHYTSQAHERPKLPNRLTQQQVTRAIDYMHAHLDRNISLATLAQAVNVSPSQLTRLFKRATGVAPHQYLMNLRIERAKHLLLTSSMSMRDVATHTGFADQSHLNRHFKRVVGITPTALRVAS
jgi:AraC family transcriptional regulator